jgi:hypothetical protein
VRTIESGIFLGSRGWGLGAGARQMFIAAGTVVGQGRACYQLDAHQKYGRLGGRAATRSPVDMRNRGGRASGWSTSVDNDREAGGGQGGRTLARGRWKCTNIGIGLPKRGDYVRQCVRVQIN